MPQRIQSKSVSRKNRSGQGWCMPQTVRNFGLQLTAQQLWCWGRDIECPDGNLLLQYGFDQHRYRGKSERSTCYRLDDEDLHVSMWGFGVFFGHRDWGGLFLSRFDFCPTWAPIESLLLAIHQIADLPAFVRPNGAVQWRCAHQLWKSLLQWMTGYERWVKKTAGIDYRHECVTRGCVHLFAPLKWLLRGSSSVAVSGD
ncbi:MAG: hypothetical protein ABJZ55_00690 [Fuerstiella sp.]